MKIVKPSYEILDHNDLLRNIELGGRVCYKSEDAMTDAPNVALLEKWKSMKHYSVFEHGVITVKFICDRGVTHELVRHRLAAFSQESTRYCNYSKEKFGREITVIDPTGSFWDQNSVEYVIWLDSMVSVEKSYFKLLDQGATPQEARSVLPNSLKTEIQVTANVREWRHILTLRTDKAAHPQMRELMIPLLRDFAQRWPILFADVLWGFDSKVEEALPAPNTNWLTSPYERKIKFNYPRLDKDIY